MTNLLLEKPVEFDVIKDINHIEEDGLRISESLTETLSVIAQAKGVSINVIVNNILWDGVRSYDKKIRNHLTSSV